MATQFNVGAITDLVHQAAINFNGNQPEGAVTTVPNRIIWAAGTHQGLISPAQLGITSPIRVMRTQLFMAGQTTWSLNLVDGTNTIVLASGTTEAKYDAEGTAFLMGGQALQLITTGGGTSGIKMVCTVVDAYTHVPSTRGV